MKTLRYLIIAIIPLFAFCGCEDEAGNPSFGADEIPRIYIEWQEYTARKVGDVLSFKPQVSPSDGASYKWTMDGVTISTEKDLEYEITKEMIGVLKFEVVRNDEVNSRTTNVLVPRLFEPKAYTKKSIAFLTKGGSIADVDWENITHLIVSSSVVEAGGRINSANLSELNMSTLIIYAHHYGVYVSLDFSGLLNSYMNAAPVYGSYTFYNAAVDDGSSTTLADNIIKEAKSAGVDGINIYMDKANTATGAFDEPTKLAAFYTYLGDQLKATTNTIDGNEYNYILSMSVVGGWTRGSLAACVNIPTYDWVNILAFGAEDLSPTAHSAQWYAEQETGVWLGWQGPIDKSRVVLAVPAFGLRYFGTPADYTWANLGSFTEYIPYKTICKDHPGAEKKDVVVLTENGGDASKPVNKIFYDGVESIKVKAVYALDKDIAGMAIWSIENDSKDADQSLVKAMNKSLGN